VARKKRAPRNRTITLSSSELSRYAGELIELRSPATVPDILDKTIWQDSFSAFPYLPSSFVDLLFVDPPYNLDKEFNSHRFKKRSTDSYTRWTESWLSQLVRTLKPTASVYICCDWSSSASVYMVASKYLKVRNRITWEREKGRGSLRNWKNCSEDIWFCTVSDRYTFNVDAVKLKRKVIAPYTRESGAPKDWTRTKEGGFRITHPSNLWNDITVPFWSMRENTDHPTQKPEKLLAKIVLASSNPRDMVFDPFLGSGTSSVVAKKLDRHFAGIETDKTYCCVARKRLHLAESDPSIQGYSDGVFWERNSLREQKRSRSVGPTTTDTLEQMVLVGRPDGQ